MMVSCRLCVQPAVMLAFSKVGASQDGGHLSQGKCITGQWSVALPVMSAFPKVGASQVGSNFAGKDLYTAGIASLTEDMIVERIAAAAVHVG